MNAKPTDMLQAFMVKHITEDTMNATPRPWKVTGLNGDAKRAITTKDNILIADCYPDSAEYLDFPENYKANAALIVEAVNCHDEAKAALEMIIPLAAGYVQAHPVGSNAAYVAQAKAILAKMEG